MALDQVATIPLPPHAKDGGFDHAAVDETRGRLYVAHTANNSVDIIDVETLRYVRSITGLPAVAGALVSPTDGLVFYVNIMDPPCVVVIDAAARRLVRTVPSPVAGPHGLDLDMPRRRLFCACDGGQLLAISAETGEVEKTAPLSGVPDVVFFNAR